MARKDSFVQLIVVHLVNAWNIQKCQRQDMGKVLKALVTRGQAQEEDGVEAVSKLATHLTLTVVPLDT